ncbi:hypothetical protein OZX68_03350 [Streptococcaceae bacterium ESL0729]|nr:hypothetical protein OZX68_03350 [Streptococcaceae bacterium ESL0729]
MDIYNDILAEHERDLREFEIVEHITFINSRLPEGEKLTRQELNGIRDSLDDFFERINYRQNPIRYIFNNIEKIRPDIREVEKLKLLAINIDYL